MLRPSIIALLAAGVFSMWTPSGAAQETIRFENPVACPAEFGCMVRNFVDLDAGPAAHDLSCGNLTYDGHTGTDIRVPDSNSLMRGVEIRAAAAGVVAGVRDEMDDVSSRLVDPATLTNRAGGNVVVIDHPGGWTSYYWHFRRGSIRVKAGQRVEAGEPLGLIGLSGSTEFLHLHFEIRKGDVRFDPYTGHPVGNACGETGQPLWTASALAELPYRTEAPFDAGFATEGVDFVKARAGGYAADSLPLDVPALVFWAEALGPRAGDEETMRLIGPDGTALVDATEALAETTVQRSRFAGIRRPDNGWTAGIYRGEYIVRRTEGGETRIVVEIVREIELR